MSDYNFKEWVIENLWWLPKGDLRLAKNKWISRALLDKDFMEDVDIDIEHRHLWNGKGLFSISRVLRPVNELGYLNVPPAQLELAKSLGSALMRNLQYFWENKIRNIENMTFTTPNEREVFTDFIKFFKENNITILRVEKFIRSDLWCGYVDCMVRWNKWVVNLEIKTRGNLQVRKSDLIQANFYYNMTGIPTILVIYDRNKREFKLVKVGSREKYDKEAQLGIKEFNKHLAPFGYPPLRPIKYEDSEWINTNGKLRKCYKVASDN